jgi:hypothetical protein
MEKGKRGAPYLTKILTSAAIAAAPLSPVLVNKAAAFQEPSENAAPTPRLKALEGENTRPAMIAKMRQDLRQPVEFFSVAVGKPKDGRCILYYRGGASRSSVTPVRVALELLERSTPLEILKGIEINHTHPVFHGTTVFKHRFRREPNPKSAADKIALSFFVIQTPTDVVYAQSKVIQMFLDMRGIHAGPIDHGVITADGRWRIKQADEAILQSAPLRRALIEELTENFIYNPELVKSIGGARPENREWQMKDARDLARVFAILIVDHEINLKDVEEAMSKHQSSPAASTWKKVKSYYQGEWAKDRKLTHLHITLGEQIVNSGMSLEEAVRRYNEALKADFGVELHFEPYTD